MQLRITLLLAVVATLCFSSCTRNYTCQCTIKFGGQPGLPDSTLHPYNIKDTKSNAKSLCEQNSYTYDDPTSGIRTIETCTLY